MAACEHTRTRARSRETRAAAAALVAAALVAGCATPPRALDSVGDVGWSGRLSVRVDAAGDSPQRAFTAAFTLRGDSRVGGLDLSTPLGSVLAQARWNDSQVALVTPQGTRRFDNLDLLTRDALGESVPVAALFDWLAGRPWPDAPSSLASAGEPAGFDQLGWHVDLSRFAQAAVSARRAELPVVTVRVQLDRP